MLDRLMLPPKLVAQAADDLHTLAVALRRLTAPEGDLGRLTESAASLPRVEDELSASISELQGEVRELREWLGPLHTELTDMDDTAEKLEGGLAGLRLQVTGLGESVDGFRGDLQELRDRIPGL